MNSPTFTKEDFFRMYHPSCMPLVKSYLDEEQRLVERLYFQYPKLKRKSLIEVGGGNGMNIEMAKKIGCKHLAVDPFPKKNLSIECIEETFENLSFDLLPKGPIAYFFHFNVAAYITDLSGHLGRLIQKDDWVFFSQWTDKEEAKKNYREYFDFFTQGRFMKKACIQPQRVLAKQSCYPCLEFSQIQKGRLCELLLAKSPLFRFTC